MSLAELLAVAGVEERVELAGPVGLLAFHGGLEGGTETVAAAAAARSGALPLHDRPAAHASVGTFPRTPSGPGLRRR